MRARLLGTAKGASAVALLVAGMGAIGGLGMGLATSGVASAAGTPVSGTYLCTVGLPAHITLPGSVATVGTAPATLHIGTTYTVQPRVTLRVTGTLLALAAQNTLFTVHIASSKVGMVYTGFTGAATDAQTGAVTVVLPAPYNQVTYWRNTPTTTPTPTTPTKGTLKTKTTLPTGVPPGQTAQIVFAKTPATMAAAKTVTATVETLDLTTTILVSVKCHPTNYGTPVSFGPITTIKSAGTAVAPLKITTTTLPTGTVGTAYTTTLVASGGTGSFTWTQTGLPTGLTLAAATGRITGTPATSGTFTVHVTVTDNAGTTATATLALHVATATTPTKPAPTKLRTRLMADGPCHCRGRSITVVAGVSVTDSATLEGRNVSTAGGTVTYTVYSLVRSERGKKWEPVASGGTFPVTNGVVPNSNPLTLPPGRYKWQASYSGDALNAPSMSPFGSESETVISMSRCHHGRDDGPDHGCRGPEHGHRR